MPGDLTRWLASTPAERDRDRSLERIYNNVDISAARVAAVTQVSQSAMAGALAVCLMKREASLALPEDAAKFDFIAVTAATALGAEIDRVARG